MMMTTVKGSCEISNDVNEARAALMGEHAVNEPREERRSKISLMLVKYKKWIALSCVLHVIAIVSVVAIISHHVSKAVSDVPDNRRQCIREPNILNGKLTNVSGLHQGDTADVECHDGHQVNGSGSVICLPSGHWNETSVCLPLPCNKLLLSIHTMVDLRHLRHRINEVDIVCENGYVLEGSKYVFCQTNGSWSEIPKCKPANCGLPSHIRKGIFLNLTDTTYNNTFSVKCKNGYVLNGKKDIKCEADGKWEDLPECRPVSCGTPTIPDHAHIYHMEGVTFEDSVSYKCENNFVLDGHNTSTCNSNGKWSAFPECKRQCLEDVNITNGRVIKKNDLYNTELWLEGDIAHIECLRGYKVNGSNITECLSSGKWSERPSCVRKQCAMFRTPVNAEITSAKRSFHYVNDDITVSCLKGFRLNGSASVKCQENEAWSTIPHCTPITCNEPNLENNVLIHKFTGVHYNSVFHVTCKHGFKLKGEEAVRCGLDGKWSGRPGCERVSCGPAAAQANAHILNNYCMFYGCEVSFGCKLGYNLIGDGRATCNTDGKWSSSHYECLQTKEHTLPPRNKNNNNNNNNHHAKSGRPGIHGDTGVGTMVAMFVMTIIIQTFSG